MRSDTRAGDLLLLGLALLPALAALPALLAMPLDTPAAWLRAGGRLNGIVGLAWLLLAAALAVRIPGLDRPFGGLIRVWRIHHVLGTGAFLLLMAHVLLLAFAALPAGLAVASVTLFPPPSRWAVWAGWGALLAMMVFLAPTYAFFGRPEYQRWKLLHLLSGAALLLALVHALPLASAPGGAAAVALWAFYGGGALIAYVWRAGIARTARRPYRITAVQRPAPRVVELSLKCERGEGLRYAPGQFVYLTPCDPALRAGRGEEHPYTLSSAPHEADLRIAIKDLGDASHALQDVAVGSRAWIDGPYGRFFPDHDDGTELWLGGGIGVTPFVSRARALAHAGAAVDIELIYCAHNPGRAYFLDELLRLADAVQGLRVTPHYFANLGPLSQRFVADTVPDFAQRTAYVCGPLPMMGLATGILRAAGVPRTRIHTEEFDLL
jgi:predicted ferric reductase